MHRTLRDRNKDEFMALEQGSMFVAFFEPSSTFIYIFYTTGYHRRGEDLVVYSRFG